MILIKRNSYIIGILISIILILTILSINYSTSLKYKISNIAMKEKINNIEEENKMIISNALVNENIDVPVFTSSEIPNNVLNQMIGNSIPKRNINDIKIKNLSYLQITYWGFDEETHIGEMIVNRKIAKEVLDIFEEIYEKKYPIEKIKLIDEYGANDEKSMQDNNTSAFCYRVVKNSQKLSSHSLGTAIDINPLYNPYVDGKKLQPITAEIYANRSIDAKGVIKKEDPLYNAFIKRGWKWGGNWKTKKDYQHFEKDI